MKKMPSRDITGKCVGECRDRVREGEEDRQKEIASQSHKTPTPSKPPKSRKQK
jgi:hypothetical protein